MSRDDAGRRARAAGHLIGDGCTLPHHAIQYTTREEELAERVAGLAESLFGDRISPTSGGSGAGFRSTSRGGRLTHGRRNPVAAWLAGMGVFGLRSGRSTSPTGSSIRPSPLSALPSGPLGDGRVRLFPGGHGAAIYFVTSSGRLARDVSRSCFASGSSPYRVCPAAEQRGRGHFQVGSAGVGLSAVRGGGGGGRPASPASPRELSGTSVGVAEVTKRDVSPRRLAVGRRPALAAAGVSPCAVGPS